MKVSQTEKNCIITDDQGDLVSFLMELTHEYKTFEKQNIILDLTFYEELSKKQLDNFLKLSKIHRKNKKSFLLIAKNIDFTAVSDKLSVVPTLVEANDIVDMEEIERDLGF